MAAVGAVPRAASALMRSVPPPTRTELASPIDTIWKVFVPVRANVPAPYLWSIAVPLTTPPRVSVPAETVTVREPPKTVEPVPRFKDALFVPT